MRKTVNIDDLVVERAERWAAADGISLGEYITRLLDADDTRRRCEGHAQWLAENPDLADSLAEQTAIAQRRLREHGERGAA
jgi:hypothetical protein